MEKKFSHGMTLVELVVAVAILGVVLLAIQVIGDVSRDRLMTSDRKARTQNEASFILDHMTRNLERAIGSNALPGVDISGSSMIRVRVDRNDNGIPDDNTATSWLSYVYNAGTNQLTYSQNCQPVGGPWPAGGTVISNKVEAFSCNFISLNNFVNLEVTTCYNPAWTTPPCSDRANPTVTMRTRVVLPQVSSGFVN